jgi:hypothetical protein
VPEDSGGGGMVTNGNEVPDRVFDSEDAGNKGGKLLKKVLDLLSASRWGDLKSRCDIEEGGEGKMNFYLFN